MDQVFRGTSLHALYKYLIKCLFRLELFLIAVLPTGSYTDRICADLQITGRVAVAAMTAEETQQVAKQCCELLRRPLSDSEKIGICRVISLMGRNGSPGIDGVERFRRDLLDRKPNSAKLLKAGTGQSVDEFLQAVLKNIDPNDSNKSKKP